VLRIIVFIVIGLMFFFSYILTPLVNLFTDYWWFDALGYDSVFWKVFLTQASIGVFFVIFLFFLLFMNFFLALRLTGTDKDNFEYVFGENAEGFRQNIMPLILIASGIISIGFSRIVLDKWVAFLQYAHQTPFNFTDPVFQNDIGFYIFSLPVYITFQRWLMTSVILVLIGTLFLYFVRGAISFYRNQFYFSPSARSHLFTLGAVVFLIKGIGYLLESYQLLYSNRGVVTGACYTDVHAQLLSYRVLIVASILGAGFFLWGIFQRSWKYPIVGAAVLVVISILLGQVYPSLVQNYFVQPNELQKETPYILRNIEYTRKAYNLDIIESADFPAEEALTPQLLRENDLTVNNIRLWDWEPLQQTYSQLQEIRLYYDFNDVDIDRYVIDGEYQQVMLSVRELNYETIPDQAKTWINQHFQYTHGYGICVSPVNVVTSEGLPEFFVNDIPPETKTPIFQLSHPGIYYGEKTNYYVFVKADGIKEFDYPEGDTNQMTIYEGQGGVPIGSLFRQALFAWKWRSLSILLTGHISEDSRVMFDRNIKKRVEKIAPFLKFDRDPYPAIHDGRIIWIMDGYTTSNMYPYSTQSSHEGMGNSYNYIRNSVKVTVDSYHGTVKFYISDPNDPMIQTYDKIFHDLFLPISEMPELLAKQIRYPHDLFADQSEKLATYHMEDPQVFYNKEDLWSIPLEKYGDNPQEMRSYYLIMKLPGEKKAEMIQLLPFTPTHKDNMIAWFCARCDAENYGKLLLYKFPKKKLTFGPMQIEARIDQDTEISKSMTLWSQKGSKVIRGNLLVIPIEQSLLYVEPIYLKAETGQLPELKQVIVAYGNKVVMGDDLYSALSTVFGESVRADAERVTVIPQDQSKKDESIESASIRELTVFASQTFQQAQAELRQGNWAEYGEKIDELENILNKLQIKSAKPVQN